MPSLDNGNCRSVLRSAVSQLPRVIQPSHPAQLRALNSKTERKLVATCGCNCAWRELRTSAGAGEQPKLRPFQSFKARDSCCQSLAEVVGVK